MWLSTLTLPSLIASSKRALRFRRCAVEFVGQHDIGKDRPFPEIESLSGLVEKRNSQNIGRKQIAGELYPAESAVEDAGKRMGQRCFPDSGHILDQQMSFGKQADQGQSNGFGLSADHRFDRALQLADLDSIPYPFTPTPQNRFF